MSRVIHEIAESLRAVASGELTLDDPQVRAIADLCAELCEALADAPEPRLLSDRDVAELPYTLWHREIRGAALNRARALGGHPPEETPSREELNAEARRNLAAARELYDSLHDPG